ncbi:MAG: hypothetical protein JWM19_7401 [Actinomycetia bacterium]|nr:hypothetical protein [Actinomycetes bacterium]
MGAYIAPPVVIDPSQWPDVTDDQLRQFASRPTPTRVLLGRRTQACWDLARRHSPQLQNNHSRVPR